MTEQKQNDKKEMHEHKSHDSHQEHEHNVVKHNQDSKIETKEKIEEKKEKVKKVKKEEAVAQGKGLSLSMKQGMAISRFIKGKAIDQAIAELEQVIAMKRAIPFKGEIPHRHGMMSGRYPINASKEFIYIIKALRGNSIANGLELDNTRITFASTSWAFRPLKRGGRKAKRANVILKARELKEAKK